MMLHDMLLPVNNQNMFWSIRNLLFQKVVMLLIKLKVVKSRSTCNQN